MDEIQNNSFEHIEDKDILKFIKIVKIEFRLKERKTIFNFPKNLLKLMIMKISAGRYLKNQVNKLRAL